MPVRFGTRVDIVGDALEGADAERVVLRAECDDAFALPKACFPLEGDTVPADVARDVSRAFVPIGVEVLPCPSHGLVGLDAQ